MLATEDHQQQRPTFCVLLADDEPNNLKDLFDVLYKENYDILLASNGREAVELALRHKPNAIIMDWDMPVMNGLDAVMILRSNHETKLIPVIMATGKMVTTTDLRMALEAGANDYIRKPFDNIEIIARVKAMIHLFQQHQARLDLQEEMARREVDQINQQLEINNQALVAMKMRALNDAENLDYLVASLESLRPYTNDYGKKIVVDIISSIKSRSLAINWNEFDHLFSKIHQSFYSTLQNRFPDISHTERKLCGLIKLNLNAKEKAAMLNVSVESIKKTKYRLKKKLGLSPDESLTAFLQDID